MWGGDELRKPRGGGCCNTLHKCLRGWEGTVERQCDEARMTQLALFILACTNIGGTAILIGKWK